MSSNQKKPRRPRPEAYTGTEQDQIATVLVALGVLVFGGVGAAFLMMVSVRLLIGIIVAVLMVIGYTLTHYLLWGRKLGDEEQQGEKWWEVGPNYEEKQEMD